MWFPKFPYTNFSQINLDWILRQVRELSEWMNRYFKDIRQDLDDEINNRIEGDRALGERIDKEIQDRTEADTALGGRIDQEISDRTEADTALGQRIDTETTERKAADQQLQNNIDAEEAAREAADTALGQRIDTETTERKAADQQLQSNINTLRSDAILKDGSTTTTAAIPFAQGIKTGSIAETTPDTGVSIEAQLDLNSHKITALANGTDNTDAVNVGQLEAFAADVHSIPAGGSSGQVLAKVNETDYNVTWVDQQGGGGSGNVPAGGTTGQVLAKSTDADYQTQWVNQPEGLPAGGTEGQVVTKTDSGAEWVDVPSGLPEGGTTGQVVTKTDGGAEWADVPKELPGGGTNGQVLTKTANGVEWAGWELAYSGKHFNFYTLNNMVAVVVKESEKIISGTTEPQSNCPFGGYIQYYDNQFETDIPSSLIYNMPTIVYSANFSSLDMGVIKFEPSTTSIAVRYGYYAPPGGSSFTNIIKDKCIAMYKKI